MAATIATANRPEPVPATLSEAVLAAEGIHCASCVALIELRLKALPGVAAVSASLASHRVRVRYDAERTDLKQVVAAVAGAGYRAWPVAAGDAGRRRTGARRLALWRLFVAGFSMMQVMMYASPAYFAIDGEMAPDTDALLRYASLVLCLPVLLFSAAPIFAGAWRDLRQRRVGMDVPVAIGAGVTFAGSVWNTVAQSGPVYFDSLAMFVFALLAGRYVEMLARERATAAIEDVARLQPPRAERLRAFPGDQAVDEVEAAALAVGDHVLVRAGAAMPADGVVAHGSSHCDESLLTGESKPLRKATGDAVTGGSLNLDQALVLRVTRVGGQTQLAAIVRCMEDAAARRPALVALADRYAGHFLWGVLLLAAVAGLAWAQSDPFKGLWVAITVLIVTCPCALSLAAPVAMSAATGTLARRGVLLTRGTALERLGEATHFVFDKTGTLTTGRMDLIGVTTFRGLTRADALRLAAALEHYAVHPVARALCMHAAALGAVEPCGNAREIPGYGVEGMVDGRMLRIGSPEFIYLLAPAGPHAPGASGQTCVVLADVQGTLAVFSFGDGLREHAAEAVHALQAGGAKVILLTGDHAPAAQRLAQRLRLDAVHAGMKPEQKRACIDALRAQGAVVAMVGDGLNDTPALAAADISIAMGSGAPLTQLRADMVLMSGRIGDIGQAAALARKTARIIRENLAWAAAYNLLAIPAAALGALPPWLAGLGMAASSLIVVLNSLRALRLPAEPMRAVPMPAPQPA